MVNMPIASSTAEKRARRSASRTLSPPMTSSAARPTSKIAHTAKKAAMTR
jgi:hypothetical protein